MVIQSCRGTFGSEGELTPVRDEHADGHATLEWVAAQPWFDGRLVMWGASYLGLTQWAIAEDPPLYVKALDLQVTAANFRDTIVYPGGSFALEMALAWLYQMQHQELGLRTILRTQLRANKVLTRSSNVLPLGKADVATLGAVSPPFQDWLEHNQPGDPWWDELHFGRRLDKVPPASLVGGWYDLFLPGQIADYEALRRAGRQARITIGPWTHVSPGLFGEGVQDKDSTGSTSSSGSGAARCPVRPSAFSSWARRGGRTSRCGRRPATNSAGISGAGAPSPLSHRTPVLRIIFTTTPTTRRRRSEGQA